MLLVWGYCNKKYGMGAVMTSCFDCALDNLSCLGLQARKLASYASVYERKTAPRLFYGNPLSFSRQAPRADFPPDATEEEMNEIHKELVKLRRLEREYWNVVDGGVEEAEVGFPHEYTSSRKRGQLCFHAYRFVLNPSKLNLRAYWFSL